MTHRPSDLDGDDELTEYAPEVPDHTMTDEEVAATRFDYSTRDPVTDVVISGPLGASGGGPGRRFANWKQAESWAREKYGVRLLARVPEAALCNRNRWALLVRFPSLRAGA